MRTDSTEIKDVTLNTDDFLEKFLDYVPRMLEHHYINKKQTAYLKYLRDTKIKESGAITVQVDFAQNYNFVVQNAVQVSIYENTLHFYIYQYTTPIL